MRTIRYRGWATLVAVVVASSALLTGPGPVRATVPGDNAQIAFESNRDGDFEIYVMNADGSGQVNLTMVPSADDIDPDWSPDGARIAFVRITDGDLNVYVMNADGTGQTALTDDPAFDANPSFSPDGTKILFETGRDGNSEVYVMNADGSGATNLTQHAAADYDGAWSPDGRRITFTRGTGNSAEIHVMNADGSGQTQLTDNAAPDRLAAWSPDGARLAFVSTRDGDSEIYVMNADGSGQANLTQNPAEFDFEPRWSPDGSRIVFRKHHGGFGPPDPEIHVMNADGSLPRQLTDNLAFDVDPVWQTQASADLAISMAASPNVLKGTNKPLTYTITVANRGPSNAVGVVVSNVLTPDMRFISATPSQGSCLRPPVDSTGTVECELGFLPNQEGATAQVVVRVVIRKTTLLNTASVASTTPDPNMANNSVSIATPVK